MTGRNLLWFTELEKNKKEEEGESTFSTITLAKHLLNKSSAYAVRLEQVERP